jgi:arylformamidase
MIIDISRALHPDLATWPGDAPFRRRQSTVTVGDRLCRASQLELAAHAGTHLDAPAHLCSEEAVARTVDELDLQLLVGPARVVDLRGRAAVDASAIHALPDCPPRLLLRTENSERPYDVERFVALTAEAAESLVGRACLLVGVDGPSVDLVDSPDLPAHRALLDAGVVIVEGLDLSRASAGDYELICLPLALTRAEGAPARAILRRP